MPGGDGVTYSPTSPFTSATMPSNGATSTVRSTMAAAAATRPRSPPTPPRPPRRSPAWPGPWTPPRRGPPRVVRVRRSSVSRSAWRRARSASRQASRATAAAASASLRARSNSACKSLFQRVSSTWPALTVSDLCTCRVAIWPPMAGASLALCRALTDPAQVLATVASLRPSRPPAPPPAPAGRDRAEDSRPRDQRAAGGWEEAIFTADPLAAVHKQCGASVRGVSRFQVNGCAGIRSPGRAAAPPCPACPPGLPALFPCPLRLQVQPELRLHVEIPTEP